MSADPGARGCPRGITLLIALSLLTLLGLMIAGAMAAAAVADRSAHISAETDALFAAANDAIGGVLGAPETYHLQDLPFGIRRTVLVSPGGDGATTTVSATRLRGGVVWLLADAAMAKEGKRVGHRRINVVARFPYFGPLPAAGLVSRGAFAIAEDVTLATDSLGAPDCGAAGAAPTAQSSDSAAFFLTGRQLARLDSALPAGTALHVRGDTVIRGGSFSGILMVDGQLDIAGRFDADGLIVVRGTVRSQGGLHLTGALMSFAQSDSPAVRLATSVITYSPCTIARVLRAASPPRVVRQRGWADVF